MSFAELKEIRQYVKFTWLFPCRVFLLQGLGFAFVCGRWRTSKSNNYIKYIQIYSMKQGHEWEYNILCSSDDLLERFLVALGPMWVARLCHGEHTSKLRVPSVTVKVLFSSESVSLYPQPWTCQFLLLKASLTSGVIDTGLQISLNQQKYTDPWILDKVILFSENGS